MYLILTYQVWKIKEYMTGSQIRTKLSEIIDSLVADNNPTVLDDELADVQADPQQRDKAIDDLIKMIEFYREEL